MDEIFVRSAYNYDTDEASFETGLDCAFDLDEMTGELRECPSKTKQSFKEECDINTIVRRFGLTGELPSNVRMPQYGDFEEVMDYHTAMNAIRAAQESFQAMPAEVRARFGNDPGRFVDFCSDEANREEARKLGLLRPGEAPAAKAPEGVIPTPQPEAGKAS